MLKNRVLFLVETCTQTHEKKKHIIVKTIHFLFRLESKMQDES